MCISSVTDGTSTAGYAADEQSTITGDTISIGNPKTDFTEVETEAWIKSLAVRAARHEAECAHFDKSTSLSRLTRQNILALDLMLAETSPSKKADEESSIYSVDQEGFYTSFHNDSGLRKSTATLVDEDIDYSPSKDTSSVCSTDSVIHVHKSSASDKFAGIKKGNQTRVLSKVTPPTPPLRTSSNKSTDSDSPKTGPTPELHSFSSQDSSVSESDAEAVFARVQNKTSLSTTGFPSLVALSTSDDESSNETSSGLKRKNPKGNLSETGSDLGLSNFSCASKFSNDISQGSGCFSDGFSLSNQSLKHSKSVLECTEQGSENLVPCGQKSDSSKPGYQSWPRAHKHQTGILKSPAKQTDCTRPQKTLNFAPVLNLFKDGAKGSVQMPLPSPTNSSSSESNYPQTAAGVGLSSFQSPAVPDQSYNLSVPVQDKVKAKSGELKQDLPLKYQPVITVTPRSRSRSGERKGTTLDKGREAPARPVVYACPAGKPSAQSTPQVISSRRSSGKQRSPNLYAVSPVMAPRDPSRQNSNSSLSSNGSTYMDMQSLKSAGSSSSLSSSDCLNFNDDNSTYMTMSSPNSSPNLSNMDFSMSSTPSGSVDSLLDLRKTPTNELETDTYQINTNLHPSRSSGYTNVHSVTSNGHVHNGVNGKTETVPIVTDNSNSIPNGYSNQSKPSLGSFVKPDGGHYTPGCRSLDSTAGDLTQVTPMAFCSPMGPGPKPDSRNGTPVNHHVSSAGRERQAGRRSRADTRKEPSYRSTNASNRRSLPSDMSMSNFHSKSVPCRDIQESAKSNQIVSMPQKSPSSSKPQPLGNNSVLVSRSGYHSGQFSANNMRNHSGYPPETSATINADQSTSRSESYRVAMGNTSTRTGSYRNAMHQSKSCPLLPPAKQSGPYRVAIDMNPNHAVGNIVDDDVLSRADSYRIAVRNTHGIVPDLTSRNTSYRVAVDDDVPRLKSKLEALGMDNERLMSGRDVRRMGITDVDQVKDIKMKPTMKHSASAPFVQMRKDVKSPASSQQHTNTKQADRSQSGGRIRKVTKQDVDPIEIVQTVDNNKGDSRKMGKNNPNRSSTYIQFDPIFEDGDDFGPPNDADLAITSLDYSKNLSNTSKSKMSLINGTVKDANANTVKQPKHARLGKSASSGVEIEDNWRFSQV